MLLKSRIKYIQSLGHKKSRQSAGEFVIEGPKIVEEFLMSWPAALTAVYGLPVWIDAHRDQLRNLSPQLVAEVDETTLERISQLSTPNQVLALVKMPAAGALPTHITQPVLVLDTIQDPGNLGTLIRTADWFGIRDLVCSLDSADCFNPKVVQSSMGSILRVSVHYTELEPWIRSLGDIPCYATMLEGENLFHMAPMDAGLILIGNESRGLDPVLAQRATHQVTIPRVGGAESLNAAVAAGLVMGWLVGRGKRV